jgi:RecB family exonuclease
MNRQDFKISYSRINAYLFCPQKYKLVYLDNWYIPINADITFGHILHNTLEQYHSKKLTAFDELIETYNDSWKKDGFENAQEVFQYYKKGEEILKNYFQSFAKNDTEILYTEKRFDANIGKYRFVGIIDRIDKYSDGSYEVMDYKTHAKIWEQEKVDKDLQLSFYVYACRNVLGFEPNKISVYFLSENKKIYTQRTKEDIDNAINFALDISEQITSENFNPNLEKCPICDFKGKCKLSIC